MTTAGRRFSFAPLEKRGLLLGLTPLQLACLVGGVLVAGVVLHSRPDASGVIAALVVVVAGASASCLRVSGQPPVVWLPVVVDWTRQRRRGPAFDLSPTSGSSTQLKKAIGARVPHRSQAIGADIEIHIAPAEPGQEAMAVLRDLTTGTWVTVIRVKGRAFALLDPADKERRLAAWGNVLAGMARTGTPIHRLQWVERSFAGDGDALHRHLAEVPPSKLGQEARGDYEELINTAGPATVEHETLLALAIHPRRASRSLRSFGPGRQGICGLLRREARLLQGQLRAAELLPGHPLDATDLTVALRTAVDPAARRQRPRVTRGGASPGAWPLATDEAWSALRADGAWYATFWIAEWPRVDVGPDFLAPLLLAGCRRTVSVTMAPVAPERARRLVEAARTADAADEELRRRAGFLPTARRRRETEGVLQRESELADGHAEFRFSGYVTVCGVDRAALEAACAEIEQAAQQARVDLRRLYGRQKEALTWTLPLARGLS